MNLENKLTQAKIHITNKSVFLSTILFSTPIHIKEGLAPIRAMTDGQIILFDSQFVAQYKPEVLAGVIAHELWHIALMHIIREGNRDHETWNIAGDHVINLILEENDYMLPNDCYCDSKYEKLSTEEVYDLLDKDSSQQQLEPAMQDLSPTPLDENTDAKQSASSKKRRQKMIADTQSKLIRAYQAAEMAKETGNLPAFIKKQLDKLTNPTIDWREALYSFTQQVTAEEYSWKKRNRRYTDIYLLRLYGETLPPITFAVDTSGSIGEKELQEILSEIKGIQETFRFQYVTLLACDSTLHEIHQITSDTDILSLTLTGSGGTSFAPVFKYVEKHPTTAVVYFTDLFADFNFPYPEVPVLWISTSQHHKPPFGEVIYIEE